LSVAVPVEFRELALGPSANRRVQVVHIFINIHMSSRNVAVQRAVYEALKKEKRAGESFTTLFLRLLNQRGSLDEVRGAWGGPGLAEDLRRWTQVRRVGGRR
jgi:predicted CopG family antitoxin